MFYLPSAEAIVCTMQAKGYTVFTNPKGYDLNLFGVRTNDTGANTFNDWVGALYLSHGVWNLFAFPATTDPGLYWRHHPMNVNGTALLKPGQYRSAWRVGFHQGKYEALVQSKPVVVYRDADRNSQVTPDEFSVQEGLFGINIHRASRHAPSTTVGKWSAGCQVLQDPAQFAFLMELAHLSADRYGNHFTYTLLTESDFEF